MTGLNGKPDKQRVEQGVITGEKVTLRPATESDREKVFQWLIYWDMTSSMIVSANSGRPVQSWEEFGEEYPVSFFNDTGDGKGRNYIIIADNEEAGTVGYDLLDKEKDRVVLDIWLRSEKYTGSGYGSDALIALCGYINKKYGIGEFIISPSIRNKRAIAAYEKAGFMKVKIMSKAEQEKEFGLSEYDDNLLMVKRM